MSKRLSSWVIGLVLASLVVLSLSLGEEGGTGSGALIEIDNRTGHHLESIELSWLGEQERWPGLEHGQSALIPVELEKAATVRLHLPPYGNISEEVGPGQRLYLRLSPDSVQVELVSCPGDSSVSACR